jgi:hypothetical protein
MGNYIQPLDLKTLFMGYFLGDANIFAYAFMILISIVCAYFNMSNKLYLIILTIGSIMFAGYMGEPIYFLILFIVGFVIFYSFSKVFR